jgi:uncharacterized heparinase superfamily protein
VRAFKRKSLLMPLYSVAAGMRRAIGLTGAVRMARPDQMQIVLPDLRATDPAFPAELRDGRIALPSGHVEIGPLGAFDGPIDDDVVARELFSLEWLRHLHTARSADAEDAARRLLLAWSRSRARRSAIANEPAVAARRALSLLSHVEAGLSGADARDFDAIMDLIADEFATLAQATLRMPLALPRLTALIASTAYAVCSGQPSVDGRQAIERRLQSELDRQILADGGHISRNPAALVELVLDLVPLQRAYLAARMEPPRALSSALQRLRGMIDLMSHADRQLGRFNGMGATALTDIFMVLKSLAPPAAAPNSIAAVDSGYIRLAEGDAVLLFDAGPGPETLAGEAPFAGALSFEFSAGSSPLIVNVGSDHRPFGSKRLDVRASAAHSTLSIANVSSAPATGARSGHAKANLVTDAGDATPRTISASTDGYRQRFGFVHHRRLSLLRDGWLLEGCDRLEPAAQATPAEAAFDIRFHLHPSVYVDADAETRTIRLTTADGSRWAFAADGATAHIEPSTFYAGQTGARQTLQIALRGTAKAATNVTWRLERMSPAAVS